MPSPPIGTGQSTATSASRIGFLWLYQSIIYRAKLFPFVLALSLILRILHGIRLTLTMSSATIKTQSNRRRDIGRETPEHWTYPTGMVWCPMKMSGMAVMKCAEMQKHFGCGTIRQLTILTTTKNGSVPFFWPWLRRTASAPNEPTIKRSASYVSR